MLTKNPFAELAASISPEIMKTYVVIMIICVVGGTLFDVIHKQSAKYFFANWRAARAKSSKKVGVAGIGVKTALSDVLTSSEFCNPHRRIAHLLGMYGFIVFVIATVIMVFSYTGSGVESPAIWPILWHLGALAICVGGYWFWFFIRVDVSAEGSSPFRLMRADLFILSLLGMATFGLLWSLFQGTGFLGGLFFALFLIATTVLFGSVPWSKFSHMFFKPAAALQKNIAKADGSLDNLPPPADRTDPATRDRHSMDLLKDAPLDMGLGIKREQPNHY